MYVSCSGDGHVYALGNCYAILTAFVDLKRNSLINSKFFYINITKDEFVIG